MPSPSIAITHAVTVELATDASPEHTAQHLPRPAARVT